tara:strand:+ start:1152 stop:2237 length:1086 start_codon:yes stop_codon:yes gene_type:complete
MFNKIYLKYIYRVFITRFFYITAIFASLIFILNILEEIKFFSNHDEVGIGLPILLTFLNLPSILFEIFPFIILIATQFFFIKFQDSSEILIFKNNGINNLKIIFHLSLLVLIIGFFIISIFHFISSNMKREYISFKNNYTLDNKYLAVINDNGLWIKDKLDDQIMIIHASRIDKNILDDLVIAVFDENFVNEQNIIAEKALINNEIWELKKTIIVNSDGKKENFESLKFKTNFNYTKINSLFSNLESLDIYNLLEQKKDFKKVGMTVSEIDLYLNRVYSLPVSLVIFLILTCILMLNVNFKKSKTAVVIVGILLSVIIYYIYYFFGLLGTNNKVPITVAVWTPNLILFLTCLVGIVNINEK